MRTNVRGYEACQPSHWLPPAPSPSRRSGQASTIGTGRRPQRHQRRHPQPNALCQWLTDRDRESATQVADRFLHQHLEADPSRLFRKPTPRVRCTFGEGFTSFLGMPPTSAAATAVASLRSQQARPGESMTIERIYLDHQSRRGANSRCGLGDRRAETRRKEAGPCLNSVTSWHS